MEAIPRLPMLSFELKHSPEYVEFGPVLKQYIKDNYGEDAATYNKACTELEQLRQAAIQVSRDYMGCTTLKKYFAQLQFLQGRFPMSEGEAAAIAFTWEDVQSGRDHVISDIKFEQAAILYNIGSLHSLLGALDTRHNAEGMKVSCTHFQCAAWAFEHLRNNFSSSSMSTDMSYELLSFHILLMLAQAQECILEKSMLDGRKNNITAKVAAQVVEFYHQSVVAIDQTNQKQQMNSRMHKEWRKRMEMKMTFYQAITFFYLGRQSEEAEKPGESLAYYTGARDKLVEASKLAKNEVADVTECLRFCQDVIVGKYESSKKDNDFVYHERVPALDSLPEVKGASLVKGIPFCPTDKEISGPDIFQKLVPMEAHEASSIYSEEKAKLTRTVTGEVEQKNMDLEQFLSSLNLDAQLLVPKPDLIPDHLMEKCAAMSVRVNAIKELTDAMAEVSGLSSEVTVGISETQELIDTDTQMTEQFEEQYGRKKPNTVLPGLLADMEKHRSQNEEGSRTNQVLHNAMIAHTNNLKLLAKAPSEVNAQLPPSQPALTPEDETVVAEVRRLMHKVAEMKEQRDSLLDKFREQIQNDDITNVLVVQESADKQSLYEEQLKKHDPLVSLIQQNLMAQDNILRAITDTNAKFALIRKAFNEAKVKRDQVIADLILSYEKYEDLLAKSKKGAEYYAKLLEKVKKTLERSQIECKVRKEERDMLLTKFAPKVPPPSRPIAPKPRSAGASNAPTPSTPDLTFVSGHDASESISNTLQNLPPTFEGPKLKDYLPFMKPQSFGPKANTSTQLPPSPGQSPSPGLPPMFPPMPEAPKDPSFAGLDPSLVGVLPATIAQYLAAVSASSQSQGTRPFPKPQNQQQNNPTRIPPTNQMPFAGGNAPPNQPTTHPSPVATPPQHASPSHQPWLPATPSVTGSGVPFPQYPPYQPPPHQHIPPPVLPDTRGMTLKGDSTNTVSSADRPVASPAKDSAHHPILHSYHQQPPPPQPPVPSGQPQQQLLPPSHNAFATNSTMHQLPNQFPANNTSNFPANAGPNQVSPIPPYNNQQTPMPSQPHQLPPPMQNAQQPFTSQPSMGQTRHPPPQNATPSGPFPSSSVPNNVSYGQVSQAATSVQQAAENSNSARNVQSNQHQFGGQLPPQQQYPPQQAQPPVSTSTGSGNDMMAARYAPQQPAQPSQPTAMPVSMAAAAAPPQIPYGQARVPQGYSQPSSLSSVPGQGQSIAAMPPQGQNPGMLQQQQQPLTRFGTPPGQGHPGMIQGHGCVQTAGPAGQSQTFPQHSQPGQGQMRQPQTFTQVPRGVGPGVPLQQHQQAQQLPQNQMFPNQRPAYRGDVPPSSGGSQTMPQQQQQQPGTASLYQHRPMPQHQQSMPPHQAQQQQQQQYPKPGLQQPQLQPQPGRPQSGFPQQQFQQPHQQPPPGLPQQQQQQQPPQSFQQQPRSVAPQHQQQIRPQQFPQQQQLQQLHQFQQQQPPSLAPQQLPQSVVPPQQQLQHPGPPQSPLPPHLQQQQPLQPQPQQLPLGQTPAPSPNTLPNQPGHPNYQQQQQQQQLLKPQPQHNFYGQGSVPAQQVPASNFGQFPPPGSPALQAQPVPATSQSLYGQGPSASQTPNNGMPVVPSGQTLPQQQPQQHLYPGFTTAAAVSAPLVPQPSMPVAGQTTQAAMQATRPAPVNCPSPLISTPTPISRQSSSLDEILSSSPNGIQGTVISPQVLTDQERQLQKEEAMKNNSSQPAAEPYCGQAALHRLLGDVEAFGKQTDDLGITILGVSRLDTIWKSLLDSQDVVTKKSSQAIARCYPMKNRDPDIMPYDETRVVLSLTKDDYINASCLNDLSPSCPKFISTQAPMPLTTVDFWTMVYEQGSEVVVQITSEYETGKKYPVYYPTEKDKAMEQGPMLLQLQSVKFRQNWVERIIHLKNATTKQGRTVVHLQFKNWPVSGFPDDVNNIVKFICEVHSFYKQQRNLTKPIIVHCGLGVGRTGVFILVYAALQELLHGNGLVDVLGLARRMLQKRKAILMKKEQLRCCYQSLLCFAEDFLHKKGILVKNPHSSTQHSNAKDPTRDNNPQQQTHAPDDIVFGSVNIETIREKIGHFHVQDSNSQLSTGENKSGSVNVSGSPSQNSSLPDVVQQHSEPASIGGVSQGRLGDEFTPDAFIPSGSNEGSWSVSMEKKQDVLAGDGGQQRSRSASKTTSEDSFSLKSNPSPARDVSPSLSQLQNPETFTMGSPERKQRITKADFGSKGEQSGHKGFDPNSTDPLASLDPMWSLGK